MASSRMKGAEAGVVLRPGLLQFDVVADDADDVRLLLDRVCEIAGVGHGEGSGIVRQRTANVNIADVNCCGEAVEGRLFV